MTTFNEFEDRVKGYDPNLFLGHLCWYAVSDDSEQDMDAFVDNINKCGFDFHKPKKASPDDVFRRVTTLNSRKRVKTSDPNVFLNFFFTEVGADAAGIYRTLVMQTVDTAGHELGHENVWQVIFDKIYSTAATPIINIRTQAIGTADANGVVPGADIVKSVQDDFNEQLSKANPNMLRYWIRRSFEQIHSTTVRPSGGVYFVANKFSAEMDAMKKVVNVVPGASIHSLPLIDDQEQRLMLKAAFEDESAGQLNAMIHEVRAILATEKGLSTTKRAHYMREWVRLSGKLKDYSTILSDNLHSVESRVDVLHQMIAPDLMQMLANEGDDLL